jgi:hypothetical protein
MLYQQVARRLRTATCTWLGCATLVFGCASKSANNGPLGITPTQLYSGYDGANSFRIGAVARGATSVTWSLADPSVGDLSADGLGVTITTRMAGATMLSASDGTHTASVPLTVTQYTPDQHTVGRQRYTQGERPPRGDGGIVMIPDGGTGRGGMWEERKPCTDCHGIARIEHGPNQCGWMSDDDLKNVFLSGTRPDGAAVYDQDDSLSHHWLVSDPNALVGYIRSLAARGTPMQE